jgi:hypothetical protein
MEQIRKWIENQNNICKTATPGKWTRGIGNDCKQIFDIHGSIVATCGTENGTFISESKNNYPKAIKIIELLINNMVYGNVIQDFVPDIKSIIDENI